jgi:nitrate/nitrite transport system ATP-binding protein
VMITNSVEEALLLSDRILPMTAGPRATLGAPVPVELAKPRSATELLHDDHAASVRGHVVASLTKDLERSRGARAYRDRSRDSQPRVCGPERGALQVVPEVDG